VPFVACCASPLPADGLSCAHNIALLCRRYNHSGVTALRFEADYSGLIHFTAAECLVEVEVVEDKVIEVPDNSTTNSTDASSKDGKAEANKGGKEAGEDKDEASKAAAKDENDMDEADKEKDDAKGRGILSVWAGAGA